MLTFLNGPAKILLFVLTCFFAWVGLQNLLINKCSDYYEDIRYIGKDATNTLDVFEVNGRRIEAISQQSYLLLVTRQKLMRNNLILVQRTNQTVNAEIVEIPHFGWIFTPKVISVSKCD